MTIYSMDIDSKYLQQVARSYFLHTVNVLKGYTDCCKMTIKHRNIYMLFFLSYCIKQLKYLKCGSIKLKILSIHRMQFIFLHCNPPPNVYLNRQTELWGSDEQKYFALILIIQQLTQQGQVHKILQGRRFVYQICETHNNCRGLSMWGKNVLFFLLSTPHNLITLPIQFCSLTVLPKCIHWNCNLSLLMTFF